MRYGLDTLAPEFFDGEVDIAVSGPNTVNNLALAVLFSGTVGAATGAVEDGMLSASSQRIVNTAHVLTKTRRSSNCILWRRRLRGRVECRDALLQSRVR